MGFKLQKVIIWLGFYTLLAGSSLSAGPNEYVHYFETGSIDYKLKQINGLLNWTRYYHEGGIRWVRYYKNGSPYGTWRYFTKDGKPEGTCSFKNGRKRGLCTRLIKYSNNTVSKDIENFRNGYKTGRALSYFNDKKNCEQNYYAGQLHGKSVCFGTHLIYVHGKPTGISETRNKDGQLTTREEYKDGIRIRRTEWGNNGILESVTEKKGIRNHGRQLLYSTKGLPNLERHFKNGSHHGSEKEWWEDSKILKHTGSYKNNRRYGYWQFWDRAGNLVFAGYYGESKQIYPGTYYDSRPTGEWYIQPTEPTKQLFFAAAFGNFKVAKAAIARGADVNAQWDEAVSIADDHKFSYRGGSPIGLAAITGSLKIVELLLNNGIHAKNINRALEQASLYGNYDVFELIIQKRKRAINFRKQILRSAYWGWPNIYELLSSHYEVDDTLFYQSLCQATKSNRTAFYTKLINEIKSGRVKRQKKKLEPCLASAVENGHYQAIKALLDLGFRTDGVSKKGDNFLHVALNGMARYWGYYTEPYKEKIFKLLIKHGADIEATNRYGSTPLMRAVSYGTATKIVKILLKHGADRYRRDLYGYSSFDYTFERYEPMISLILTDFDVEKLKD